MKKKKSYKIIMNDFMFCFCFPKFFLILSTLKNVDKRKLVKLSLLVRSYKYVRTVKMRDKQVRNSR